MDFQEQNAQWLTNWITKRKRLLAKNMRKVGFTPYYYSTHDSIPLANEEANLLLKRYEETPIYVGDELPDDLYKKPPNIFLSRKDRSKKESLRKAGTLFSGVNVNLGQQDLFIWFPDNIQSYRSGIHEGTHSTAAVPQELLIEKLDPKKNLLDSSYNDYLDMPTEIYARRNQFARDMNLNPNKRIKRRDIRNWRKQDPFMFNLDFGRYKNKFIKKLFNDVALNDSQTEDVLYAKQGTKLIDLSLKYPIVGFKEKPWAEQYFKNNTHVAGMALGQGANEDYSPERTVIINPYNEYMQDPNKLRGLEFLERSRHYMDENKIYFPITLEQKDYYDQPAFENSYKGLNDTIKFQTDASRYLAGDDNLLTKEQKEYIDKMFEGVHNGEEVIITPDYDYTLFLNTLPPNLKYASEEEYPTYRYWQLHNKPKNFEEAKAKRMYSWHEGDHLWHANSVVEMPDGTIEFMKPKNHPTLHMETDWYNKGIEWDNKGIPHKLIPKTTKYRKWLDFRNHYDLDSSSTYYKYIPK